MRYGPLLCTLVGLWTASCISSLPDEPLTVPAGPVQGLLPRYLTEEEARTIRLADVVDEGFFPREEQLLAYDDFFIAVDTLRGLVLGEVDSFTVFRARSVLLVPGVTFAQRDEAGQLVFDNHGDRVTGRFGADGSFELLLREPGVLPPAPTWPLLRDLSLADDLTQPSALVTEAYFECFDESRGLLGGWTPGTITTAPCLTRTGR